MLDPIILTDLALDLSDPDSEISQFVEQFFIDYLLSVVQENRRSEVWNHLSQLSGQKQTDYLNQIRPDFMADFQNKLQKELINLFTKK